MIALRSFAAVLAAWLVAAPAAAQQYEILHAFEAPLADAMAPMVLASDGALYGTFATGGRGGVGAIFVTRPQSNGSVVTEYLRALERSEGGGVIDALVEGHDGWLYGVAPEHGANGRGTVFKFNRSSGQLVVLHAFSGPDGATPRGSLVVGDDGNYYGTTTAEGAGAFGTVFKLTPAGVLTTLHAFQDGKAWGLLVQAGDGNLYGANGAHLFRLALDGTRTVIHTLAGGPIFGVPPIPFALIKGADGHLYGVTRGSPLGPVRFFKLTLAGALTDIHTIENSGAGGDTMSSIPLSIAPDGGLLGTLPLAGANDRGTLFHLTTTGTFTVVHHFTEQEGRSHSGIVRHSNGHYYGTTVQGSVTGHGMIYSVGAGGSLIVRDPFTPVLPYAPSAPPVDGPDGALYGTTVAGGVFNLGTVYRLSASGLTVLHHFAGVEGAHPVGKLLLGPDGKFYGTTHDGGTSNRGSIFRISTTGVYETLHTFSPGQGRNSTAGLIRATDGNFWGTTLLGGSADSGTIFRISPAGVFTQMHSFVFEIFTENTMVYPYAGLIQAQDGNFYGTTYGLSGVYGGTVFRFNPAFGSVTRLVIFPGSVGGTSEGPKIFAPLIEGSDGGLYGGACCGGGIGDAARPQIFRLTTTGEFATLREMDGVFSALTEGTDQAFYGVTSGGSLFSIDSTGSFAELKVLTDLEGSFFSGLRTDGDAFVGSAYAGGPGGGGVIFRFQKN